PRGDAACARGGPTGSSATARRWGQPGFVMRDPARRDQEDGGADPEADEDGQDQGRVAAHAHDSTFVTFARASAVTEIESRPTSARNAANSGWSLGAWPHRPTLRPAAWASRVTWAMS